MRRSWWAFTRTWRTLQKTSWAWPPYTTCAHTTRRPLTSTNEYSCRTGKIMIITSSGITVTSIIMTCTFIQSNMQLFVYRELVKVPGSEVRCLGQGHCNHGIWSRNLPITRWESKLYHSQLPCLSDFVILFTTWPLQNITEISLKVPLTMVV